ncbi:hypothetical protein [Winogradskyella aurantiaca]|uniref:hypothetical protein n=1 Tax=Winogradskyella aurantiaca TaxID=2219558 RepID=UPI000E1E1131|nr:hypothetical protein [Winogradskyella aurantiaca]
MRITTIFLFALIVLVSCKNEAGTAEAASTMPNAEDGLVTMRGEFIFHDGAAVLQTRNTIYGVVIDDMLEELQRQVIPYKKSDLDMVTVTLRGKRIPKPEGTEGWPFSIEIKEILKIENPESGTQDVIELSK